MPDQPAAARAHRRAHADFFFPGRRAGQQQIGEVDAGDQQHQAGYRHQHPTGHEELLAGIDAHGIRSDRREFHAAAFVLVRIFLLQARSDRPQGAPRLVDAHPGFQTAGNEHQQAAARLHEFRERARGHLLVHSQRHPEFVGRSQQKRALESRRSHTNHGQGGSIQIDRLADEAGVAAELPYPQAVADHHHRMAAGLVLIRQKRAAQLGFHAQNVKIIYRS